MTNAYQNRLRTALNLGQPREEKEGEQMQPLSGLRVVSGTAPRVGALPRAPARSNPGLTDGILSGFFLAEARDQLLTVPGGECTYDCNGNLIQLSAASLTDCCYVLRTFLSS